MKTSTFTQAVILMLIIAFAASCGSSRSTPRYPDQGRYPGDYPRERYPDHRRYPYPPDERQTHRLPPGQAKKIYGHQSAKAFSHGQRKKYGYSHGNASSYKRRNHSDGNDHRIHKNYKNKKYKGRKKGYKN